MQEDVRVPVKTLTLAASNENQGHFIVPRILEGNDSWLQNEVLVERIIGAAATSGQVKLLHYIFERCGIEESDMGNMLSIGSLYNAVPQNDEGKAIQLLADGTDPDMANPHGRTPLWQACARGYTSMVRHLLGTGAVELERTDLWERTVLHWAAALNHSEVVKLLMKHGADPDHEDVMGLTAFQLAQR
jgi:Ankyrin repeats (3 copies)